MVKMEYGSIMEPSFPAVAVHKGWLDTPKSGGSRQGIPVPVDPVSKASKNASREKPSQREFAFVNSSTGRREKDPGMNRLIKSHARKNQTLEKKRQKKDSAAGHAKGNPDSRDAEETLSTAFSREVSDLEAYIPELSDLNSAGQLSGASTAWCAWEYPIEMQPRTHRLLEYYLTYVTSRMYPEHLLIRANPLKSSAWFRYSVTDAAMLHAMLYSGALYLALLEGRTENRDTIYHLNKTISIVNGRLSSSPHFVEDSTIGAITCLALGSAIAGNLNLWHIHMRGLKQIVEKRGNLSAFGGLLQAKILRSDITGAIDYGAVPYLELERSNCLSVWSTLPQQTLRVIESDVTRILTNCGIHADLLVTVIALAWFAQAIRSAALLNSQLQLDLGVCAEDMYWIEHRLLAFPSALPRACRESDVDRACRLGALIYMKATLTEFPHSKTGSSLLVEELQEALQNLSFMQVQYVPLLTWLSMLGAAVSKSPVGREFFVGRLRLLVASSSSGIGISPYSDEDFAMSKVLPVRLVLGNAVDGVWESAMGVALDSQCLDKAPPMLPSGDGGF